jgi:hypothetical protein
MRRRLRNHACAVVLRFHLKVHLDDRRWGLNGAFKDVGCKDLVLR